MRLLARVERRARGRPLDARHVVDDFKRHLRRAEQPDIRFHDLRHSCASLLLAQNVHPRVVMEILGHSTISLTMNTYSHVLPKAQRDAAEPLDRLFTAERADAAVPALLDEVARIGPI